MAIYNYRAKDRRGEFVTGKIESSTAVLAEKQIEDLKLIPISIEEASSFYLKDFFPAFYSVTKKDVVVFSRQLAVLYQSGVSISKSLELLIEFTRNRKFREVLLKIKFDVENGMTLSKSLAKHPKIFSEIYVDMVEVGESSGLLYDTLVKLALLTEKEITVKAKVKRAVFYPKIVVSLIVIALVIFLGFIMPGFTSFYNKFNVKLPIETKVLVSLSNIFVNEWLSLFLGAAIFIAGAAIYLNSSYGKPLWDKCKLKMPIFGTIFYKSAMSRFVRIFGILYKSGLPVNKVFELVKNETGNKFILNKIDDIQTDVSSGKSITESFKNSEIFSGIIIQMLSIGEETGQIDEMLARVADYFDEELDHRISMLHASIEPILLTVIFGTVLFIVLAVYLPVFDIVNFAKKG